MLPGWQCLGDNAQMTDQQMHRHLRRANAVAQDAATKGRHPFGAVLVAPDFETVMKSWPRNTPDTFCTPNNRWASGESAASSELR